MMELLRCNFPYIMEQLHHSLSEKKQSSALIVVTSSTYLIVGNEDNAQVQNGALDLFVLQAQWMTCISPSSASIHIQKLERDTAYSQLKHEVRMLFFGVCFVFQRGMDGSTEAKA